MPNGSSSPDANTAGGAPAPRRMRMRPPLLSARNTSPFGAVRIARGPSSPLAISVATNPGGTAGPAPSGRSTTEAPRLADALAYGAGMVAASYRWRVPGASAAAHTASAARARTARDSSMGVHPVAGPPAYREVGRLSRARWIA